MAESIDVSIIAPVEHLEQFVRQYPATVHHVAAQRVLGDARYREFFRSEADLGAAIIVDNGVFDLGESLPAADLVRAAALVGAREIILPDVIRDGPATIKASDEGAARILDLTDDITLCAVVQGSSDRDWLDCYHHFASRDYVGSLAFIASRKPSPDDAICRDRVLATAYVDKHGLVNERLTYRLLGLGRTGHLELFAQREHEWISSVDCAGPVILGAMGIALNPDGPYEKVPTPRIEALGAISPERFDLIRYNIDVVRRAANCSISLPALPA